MTDIPLGHNSRGAHVTIESRLFNSLSRFARNRSWRETFTFPAGATVGDLATAWGIPENEIFLVMRNGRDITSGLVGDNVNLDAVLDDGDVIAFSGPVPYSYGYGAPIV